MMRPSLASVALGATLLGCHDTRVFPEDRVYSHDLFTTPEQCEAAQQAGFINCVQFATFCKSGEAVVMVTDIRNPARYRIDGDRLTVSFPASSELSDPLEFRLGAREDTLYLLPSLREWRRTQSLGPPDC